MSRPVAGLRKGKRYKLLAPDCRCCKFSNLDMFRAYKRKRDALKGAD